jgi:hypothetical protein
MAALPDINVLLPLVYGAHAHPAAAVAWLDTVHENGELVPCRVRRAPDVSNLQAFQCMAMI